MNKHIYEREYSADFMRWQALYDSIKDISFKPGNNSKLDTIQETISEKNDAALAYYFAQDIGYKNYKMQAVVVNACSSKYAYLFAKNIKNADINALQNIIINNNDIKYIAKFGCHIKGANLKKIESIILENKKAKWAHMLIKHTNPFHLNKLKKIIIESKKPRYLFELVRHIKNKKDILFIQNLIIESKSLLSIRKFAEKIKYADIEKLEQVVLDSDNMNEIKKFALNVKNSKMRNFIVLF